MKIPDGAFTVDVEDYFHVSAFSSCIHPETWDQFESRVEIGTRHVLELAAKSGTKGTFFVLGWVAKRHPELVKEIYSAGHEIGCHSYMHQLVYDLGPDRFRNDLIRGRNILEDLIGIPVRLHRAPSFSVTTRSRWALEILAEEGFHTDSSIYPVRHDRYGIPDAPPQPHVISTRSGSIREFPGMICNVAGINVPVGGGGYLRLFPWSVTRRLLRKIRQQNRPLNVYVHPWEFDTEQPRISSPLRSRFRHYQNLNTTSRKVGLMLQEFRLTSMSQVLESISLPAEQPSSAPDMLQPPPSFRREMRLMGSWPPG